MISYIKDGITYYLSASKNSFNNNLLIITNNVSTANEFQITYYNVDNGYYKIQSLYNTNIAIDIGTNNLYDITDNENQKFQFNKVGNNKYNIFSVEKCKYLCVNKDNKIDFTDINNTDINIYKEFTILQQIDYNIVKKKNTLNLYFYHNYIQYYLSLNDKKLKLMDKNNGYYPITSHWYIEYNEDDGYLFIKNNAINGYLDAGSFNNNILDIQIRKHSDDFKTNTYIRWKFHLINNLLYLYNYHHNKYLFFKIKEQVFTLILKQNLNNNDSNILGNILYDCDNISGITCNNSKNLNALYYTKL
jgi:hypothetical protein